MAELQPKEVKIIRPTSEMAKSSVLRVAAYCRVSTDSDDQVNSFIAQVKYYNDFIRLSDGMELVDIYADEGITGTSVSKREEFKRMIKDSRLGKIDRIYVKSVTRFARNSLECIENIRILKENGTSVYFENDGIDTDSMNSEMILFIKSAFAQSEALSGSKRVSTACRMRMERGSFVTTCAPFGYRLIEKQLIVVPEEAEIVRKIYELCLQGLGTNKIIAELNENAGEYAPWGREQIRYILHNEKYVGDSLWQKTFTPAVLPLRSKPNRGEVDQYYTEDTQEAIIDKATFQKAQQMLNRRAEKSKTQPKTVTPKLARMIYCGDCGRVYKPKGPNEAHRWVCSASGTEGRKCATTPITEYDIEKTFVNMYNRLKQNADVVLRKAYLQLSDAKKRIALGVVGITEIDKEIAELSNENSMYIKFYQQNMVDEVTFREQTGVVGKRIGELRVRRQRLLSDDKDEACIDSLRNILEELQAMPEALLWFDRDVFDKLIAKIIVSSKTALEFELKCGIRLKEQIEWD